LPILFQLSREKLLDFLLLFREQGTGNREQGTERRIEALSLKNSLFLTFAGGLLNQLDNKNTSVEREKLDNL
jgi:hypothetical protein